MKSTLLFPLIIIALLAQQCALQTETETKGNSSRTLLAIFAHPDDEASAGPVLAKYAAEGVQVYLCVATDGRLGVTDHAKIPAGDSLAAVRKLEMQCAAEILGIKPPIMLGLHDQLKMGEGNRAFNEQMDSLRKSVKKLFTELKPDVVITWGASGWTGHHDHRLVGSVVTEVFESEDWPKPVQLYYSAIPTGSVPAESPLHPATVDKKFLTVSISVTDADYEKSKQAGLCHKSQYTAERIEMMQQTFKSILQNTWYFQPHCCSEESKKSFF